MLSKIQFMRCYKSGCRLKVLVNYLAAMKNRLINCVETF